MLFPSMQVLGADVDDVAADRLSRVQRQRQVLVYLINAQFCTSVDRSLINSVWLCQVDEVTADNIIPESTHSYKHTRTSV